VLGRDELNYVRRLDACYERLRRGTPFTKTVPGNTDNPFYDVRNPQLESDAPKLGVNLVLAKSIPLAILVEEAHKVLVQSVSRPILEKN
jgi:hypothetical protein